MDYGDELLKRGEEILDKSLRPFISEVTRAWVEHRVTLLRDYATISSVILAGLAIFVVNKDIKSPWLLYLGIALFITLLIFNFIVMRFYFEKENKLLDVYESAQHKLLSAMAEYESNKSLENATTLKNILVQGVNFSSRDASFIQKNGEKVVFLLFLFALVSTFLGLSFEVNLLSLCSTSAG